MVMFTLLLKLHENDRKLSFMATVLKFMVDIFHGNVLINVTCNDLSRLEYIDDVTVAVSCSAAVLHYVINLTAIRVFLWRSTQLTHNI